MRPRRIAPALVLALVAGCATSETPSSAVPAATTPARSTASSGRTLRAKESVLAPESGSNRMRSERSAPEAVKPVDTARAAEAPQPATQTTPPPRSEPSPPPAAAAGTSMVPVRGMVRPGAPIEVEVRASEGHGALAIDIEDRDGTSIERISVVPGVTDLMPLTDVLAKTDRALWLQLREDDRAVGAPLWFVPLRAAPPVRTVRSIRVSNQQPYLRVVGWGDRALDPSDPETAAAMPAWQAPDPVVTSGFRIEPAQEALLRTDAGVMRVAFAPDVAPATVENFLRLAREGFYDGTTFHRVVPQDREGRPFVIQGGDPTGTGDGGPGWNLALEPSDLKHDRGVLGMARGDDPHSAGSQFYIALSREGTARLDGQYCTFGMMVDGWDTLDRIAAGAIGDASTGRPAVPVRIERVELVPATPRAAGPLWTGAPKPGPASEVSPSPTPSR